MNHHVYRLKSAVTKFGRQFENDCVIDDLPVSRRHAEIRQENGSFVLYDLNSTKGTFVNNIHINKKALKTRDIGKALRALLKNCFAIPYPAGQLPDDLHPRRPAKADHP
ncbi:MAG: FHA domain-containing protein [Anaerolineales bacterium]|nr:FHA domain-containing protein [Anaerolineales bacterium]